jgi:1,4-dihydroxy-2-naphthoate octaprenyltransferase
LTKYWKIFRINTLGCSISPVLIAYLFSARNQHGPGWLILTLTLLVAVGLQVEANFADDYFDDNLHFRATIVAASLATVSGTWVIFLTKTYFLFPLGILCHLSLLLYSGGKRPLGNQLWGDALAFFFFGPVACCGSYYLFTKGFSIVVFGVSCALGLLIVTLLELNHLRDVVKDQSVKRVNFTEIIVSHYSKTVPDLNYQLLARRGAIAFNATAAIIWLTPVLILVILL